MSKNLKLQVLLKAVDQASRPFKAVQQESKKLSGEIRDTNEKLKELNAQANKIEGFRKAKTQLNNMAQELKKAQAATAKLATEIRNSGTPTKQQTRLFEASKRAAAELSTKYSGLRLSVQQQRSALSASGISTKNLTAEQKRLKLSAESTTTALNRQKLALNNLNQRQHRINQINSRYQQGQSRVSSIRNGSAAGLGVATAGLYGAARVIAPGIEFDSQMSGTQAILGLDKSDEKLAAIRKQARDIGGSTAFSPTDVARTQDTLARSGYDADAILAATKPTVNLSLASGLDIAEAADIVTNMQSAFNLPLNQIKRVSDVMTKGFTSSNTNLLELGEAMKYVAPIAEAAGASIEDTTALLGVLADNGIKGSMAGTGASAIFNRLQAPVWRAKDALGELKITTRDKKGNMLPVEKILKDINHSLIKNKLGTAQRAEYLKVIFGEEALKSAIKAVDAAGNGKLQAKKKLMVNSDGAAQAIAKVKVDNLDGDLKSLVSAGEDLRIEIFDKQDSSLRKLSVSLTQLLIRISSWTKKNPELAGTLTKVTGGALALVGALGAIGLIAWPVLAGVNLLIAGAGLLGTAFSAAGIGIASVFGLITFPVVAAVAIIVAAALTIRKYWEPISAFFGGVMDGIKTAVQPALDQLAPFVDDFGALADKIKAAWNGFKNLLSPVKETTESLEKCRGAGQYLGECLGVALRFPLDALRQFRSSINWVLEKLGVIDSKSNGLADKVPKNGEPGSAAFGGGGYQLAAGETMPIAFGGGMSYVPLVPTTRGGFVDKSSNVSHYQITIPPGMSKEDALALMAEDRRRQEREKRARQRSQMDND